jgi:tetratricopeptide (TPR) repeat protein
MPLGTDDLVTAVGALEGALSMGASPRALAPLAEAQRLLGDTDRAIETAQSGLEAFPDHVGIRIVLARALSDAGRRAEAARAYQEIIDRDPGNLEAQSHLASAEVPAEPPSIESERGTEGRSSRPTGDLHAELADLGGLFTPRRPTEDALESDDGLWDIATLTLAEIYARQGLLDQAVDVCVRVLERKPDDEAARSKLEEYRRELTQVG